MKNPIKHVPTTIITGFLGTGKTSMIQHLLKHKPENERWAILVNEFGSVGIDGTLYKSTQEDEGGVFVREVPGGCMCCISGLPMQIALNVLLKLSDPHRLLIEPSGLGHPVEVLALLKSQYYKEVLDIQNIITVIDPQQFFQLKYFEHETYQQQLAIADVIAINKTDRCQSDQLTLIEKRLQQKDYHFTDIYYTEFGQIEPQVLSGTSTSDVPQDVILRTTDEAYENNLIDEQPIPLHSGFVKSMRFGEGYHGLSWRYDRSYVFNKATLLQWISGIQAERVKGIFVTDSGVFGINAQQGQVHTIKFNDCKESRIEIIAELVDPLWDMQLTDCISHRSPLKSTGKLTKFVPINTGEMR